MTSQRPIKWSTIKRKFPDEWVALKPSGGKYSNDGVVLYHHPNRKAFYKHVNRFFINEKFLAFNYTGNPIKTGKDVRILMSTW